ncbi:MAG: hypothetical protein JSV44_07735 [Candidatus Zixiibacteriota bacterium]|nr:MAG: hypothetical protein JSV44_07735 [candidate division Zixibacteria bacterium]
MMLSRIFAGTVVCQLLFCTYAVSYDTLHVEASLDTLAREIIGKVLYRLPDNSRLATVELQLFANLYASEDSPYLRARPHYLERLRNSGGWGGMHIDSIFLDEKNLSNKFSVALTRGVLDPGVEVAVGGRLLTAYFTTAIPEIGDRLSSFDGEFLLDGWFPAPAILSAEGEWYNPDYGPFAELVGDFHIYDIYFTAPETYVTVAPVPPELIASKDGMKTCRYTFGPAHDFALALSPHYLTDSVVIGGTKFRYYYREYEEPILERIKTAVHQAYQYMSEKVGPYRYSHLSFAFAGTAMSGGVEFPAMAGLSSPKGGIMASRFYDYMVTHEAVHQWFYGMVASDQVLEPWMDEAIATFFTNRIFLHYRGGRANLFNLAGFEFSGTDYLRISLRHASDKGSINRPASMFMNEGDYFGVVYFRGALAVETLDNLLGDSLSGIFWQTYFERYCFKRGASDDFVGLVEEVGGAAIRQHAEELFSGSGQVDYAVEELSNRSTDSGAIETTFTLTRKGPLSAPADYILVLYNGDTLQYRWEPAQYAERISLQVQSPAVEAIIDPENKIAVDVNLLNNSLSISSDGRPGARLASGVMFLVESLLSLLGGW